MKLKTMTKTIGTIILLLNLLACNRYYTGVVVDKSENAPMVEVEITEQYYIFPDLEVYEWDTLYVGDTVRINKRTYRLKK